MPYITTERIAEIRAEIKKTFPGFKFSITRRHYSTINIVIVNAPFDMLEGQDLPTYRDGTKGQYYGVNVFHIKEHFKNYPRTAEVLSKIYEIANNGNYIVSKDGDYGNIPKFYVDISIGDFEKPFVCIPQISANNTQPQPTQIPTPITISPDGLEVVNYSDRAIAIFGNTKPIKDFLKDLGGRFNAHLQHNGAKVSGWVFSVNKRAEIMQALNIS
jgi:Large polyvalent protein associated domain 29